MANALPVTQEATPALVFLDAAQAALWEGGSFVVVVRTRDAFLNWQGGQRSGVEWLEVEGLLDDAEVWSAAAGGQVKVPLDVVVSDPAADFAKLYRLVDARIVRDVRVSIPVLPGWLKALRLAVSIGLPVRLLPGQPSSERVAELHEAVEFYLRDPSVEAPIEFFHSVFAAMRGAEAGTLWSILEQDPAVFSRVDSELRPLRSEGWVQEHVAALVEAGGECASCQWQKLCAGYFKVPDAPYDCVGVKGIFSVLADAAKEIAGDLAVREAETTETA